MVQLVEWEPPKENQVALNVDGCFFTSTGQAGFGGLIRDHTGKWIKGFRGHIDVVDSYIETELMGIMEGLKFAWELKYRDVSCRSDSKQAISLIKDPTYRIPEYANITDAINELISRDWAVSLDHTYREGNQCADLMAKMGAKNLDDEIYLQPPAYISSLLLSDAKGTQYERPAYISSLCLSDV